MLRRIYQKMFGQEMDLRERVFRAILLLGSVASVIGSIESAIICGEYSMPLILLLVVMIVALVATFKYRKVDFSAMLIGVLIIAVVFPEMFLGSGGIRGGATIWLTLGFVYIFLMFNGKQLALFLLFTVIIDGITYWQGYSHPETVGSLGSEAAVYIDSAFSMLVVGLISGLLLKFQSRTFDRERAITSRQKKELEEISDSKNTFFTNMSHEIRTPINTIIGWNEMILREAAEEDISEYAENVQNASEMLLSLVNDILDLSQLEIKKMEILSVKYEIKKVVQDLVNMLQVHVQEKNLEFHVDIADNIPSVLLGDEKRMKQIILNLLTNAVKYTEKGYIGLSMTMEERMPGEAELRISVSDSGIGIRKEDLDSLYDVFQRVNEKKITHVEGSGLGLAIVKQLLDLMDGEITVDSIYTQGSTFTITVTQPIVDATPIGKVNFLANTKKQSSHYYEQSFEAPEARILVVDDHMINAWSVAKRLRSTKVQVDIVGSGAECLERTQQKYYHVILMDHMMPGMDGVETLKELRRQENGLCRDSGVLLVTATSLSEAEKIYQENHFDGYIEKPIRSKKLEEEVLRLLPEDIIEYRQKEQEQYDNGEMKQKPSQKRRKRIIITTDSVCDLSEQLQEKYDIKVANLYIKTDKGRYEDSLEIDSDSLAQYLSNPNNTAIPDSISMEEYEQFFAQRLTEANEVIHITVAEGVGVSYATAVAAAKGFDHVHLVDSGMISGGQGLLVLYAADLAMKGYTTEEILQRIEKMKKNVEFECIFPSLRTYYQNGRIGYGIMAVCEFLNLHPVMKMHQKRLKVVGVRVGNIDTARKKFLRKALRKKRRIDKGVVYFTHVACTIKQLNGMETELTRYIPFKNVIMERASGSIACNGGLGTIGVAYVKKGSEWLEE